MANILLAYQNRWDEATLTAGTQLATLPVDNTQTSHLAEVWRTSSSASLWYIDFDYGSSVALDVFAALGTNLTSAATFRLRLSNTSAAAGNLLDTSTISASVVAGYPQVYCVLGSTVSARYGRLELNDASLTYLQVGRVFSGPKWTPTSNVQYGWSLGYPDDSRKAKSRGGQTFVDVGARYRVLDFTLDFLTEAEMYSNAMEIDRRNGLNEDILVMRDNAGVYRSQQSVYGLITNTTAIVHANFNIFQKRYTVEERL